MKMVWFFLISALIHSLVLALPVLRDQQDQGNAIPVTLVLGTRKAAPVKTPSNGAVKPKTRPTPAKKLTHPKVVVKKPIKIVKKSTVRKTLRNVRLQKPSKQPKKKKPRTDKPRADVKPVAKSTGPKDVQKVQTKSQPEVEKIIPHFDVEDFMVPEPSSVDSADQPTMETAIVSIRPKSNNRASIASQPNEKLEKTTKGVSFLGDGKRTNRFVGVRYAKVAKPKYPRHARKMGWEGTTLLKVLVDQKGGTKQVEVSRSSGFTTLDKAAMKAVKRWRFQPARSGSGTVESWVKIPIVFDLEETKRDSLIDNR